MKLKGSVLIIGSLFWEDHLKEKEKDFIRRDWRQQNLLNQISITPAPIRYGRKSQTRKDTYTMIFTKGSENSLGQGLLLEFNTPITSFEELERQAIALAIAEGIYTDNNKRLTSNWGSVGLLVNPALKAKDQATFELITTKWADIYSSYRKTFIASDYKCVNDVESPINQNGILTITWQKEMNELDLLIGTPVVPNPKRVLTSKEISDKIKETGYSKYFESNTSNNIKTTQDADIFANLLDANL